MIKSIVLGIVEGISEWLPISSTGHMILVNELINNTEGFTASVFVCNTAWSNFGGSNAIFSQVKSVFTEKDKC